MTVKCMKCGKRYDWEENDGVCPKCCMYNWKESAEEQHQRLHETEDNGYTHRETYTREQGSYGQSTTYTGRQSSYGHQTYNAGGGRGYEQERVDRKSRRIRNFLIAGIVAAMFLPYAVEIGSEVVKEVGLNNAPDASEPGKEGVEIVPVLQGSAFCIQEEEKIQVTVAEAVTIAEADTLAGAPMGEKLVAVHMSSQIPEEYQDQTYDYAYKPTEEFYIASGAAFKDAVDAYCLEEVIPEIWEMYPEFDYYSVLYESDGYAFFFVPAEAAELTMYVEMRNTQTGEVEKIYEIPVKLEEA